MLNPNRLEHYLVNQANTDNNNLLPNDACNVRISNVKKLSGGITNNVYSLSLRYQSRETDKNRNLIFKGYNKEDGLLFYIHHLDKERRPYMREYDIEKALGKVGFPVPEVYVCESDPTFLDYPFLLMKQETASQITRSELKNFARLLAALHNLDFKTLNIRALRNPKDDLEFAKDQITCIKRFLNQTEHFGFVKKDFDHAIRWLESRVADMSCSKYSLIHGEYHPGHTLVTDKHKLEVIDWESAMIGDPAFDVGYAYHMVKCMFNDESANNFLEEYLRDSHGEIASRFEFYKVVALLVVSIDISSLITDPINAYRRFGRKALAKSLAFPFALFSSYVRDWLKRDFLLSFLYYSQNYIHGLTSN